ncbi:DNA-directed RNA polymerase, partial [Globisporangium splendens]
MFVLTRLSDVIPVNPELFDTDYTKVLVEEIDRKYANKVIADVGLCITIYDFVHIGDAFVHPSDGTSHSQGKVYSLAPLTARAQRILVLREGVHEDGADLWP